MPGFGPPPRPAYSYADSAQTVLAALPNFIKAIRTFDDGATSTIRIIGLGSSVGGGATIPAPDTQAPSARLYARLNAELNRLGNMTFAHTNGAVGGTTITDANSTDYAAAKVTAGGSPKLVCAAYGMNDGAPGQYHKGQTYPGVYTALQTLLASVKGDNADLVLFTTPHPHSTRYPWTDAITSPTYPTGGVAIPTNTAAASVISGDWSGTGATIPASYRHLRVNQAIRQFCTDYGIPCLDAERYWFRAVAKYGEDALYDTNEYVHPNLLGHQKSYWLAIEDFVKGLIYPQLTASPGTLNDEHLKYKVSDATRTTTSLSDDTQLQFYAGADQVWEIEADLHFSAPAGGDLKVGIGCPSGSAGRIAVIGPAYDATTYDTSPGIFRGAAWSDGAAFQVGGNGADSYAKFKAIIRTGSTAGNVTMQFAQQAASGTTTIYRDTFLRARRIA